MTGVWLITGAQASGKSTVAHGLAAAFERGAHVRGGQFYRSVVKGWVTHDDRDRPAEARRLLELRYRLSALVADEYARAGFVAVVNDNIYGSDVAAWLVSVRSAPKYLVVLRPSIDVVAARDAQRQRTTGKVAYRGSFTPALNDDAVASIPGHLGLWLDTSRQTAEETIATVLARRDEARVAVVDGV